MNGEPRSGIATIDLGKDLGGRPVLDAVDLDVPAGSVLALLGPNGAEDDAGSDPLDPAGAGSGNRARRRLRVRTAPGTSGVRSA